jgi:hypothetical protein
MCEERAVLKKWEMRGCVGGGNEEMECGAVREW